MTAPCSGLDISAICRLRYSLSSRSPVMISVKIGVSTKRTAHYTPLAHRRQTRSSQGFVSGPTSYGWTAPTAVVCRRHVLAHSQALRRLPPSFSRLGPCSSAIHARDCRMLSDLRPWTGPGAISTESDEWMSGANLRCCSCCPACLTCSERPCHDRAGATPRSSSPLPTSSRPAASDRHSR